MSVVATKKLMFLLADEQDRTYYVEAGVVKKSVMPIWLNHNPDGWKDIQLQWATNQKYFSTLRSFSNAVKFVDDGLQIITDRMFNGAGTEEIIYMIILRNEPSLGLNYYQLEYKSRLDLSKFNGDISNPNAGVNTLQDDVFAVVQANDTTTYPIAVNSSNPAAIKILFNGTLLQDKLNYQPVETVFDSALDTFYAIPLAFINNEGDSVGIINQTQNYATFGFPATYLHDPTNENYIIKSVNAITVRIKGTITIDVAYVGTQTNVGLYFLEFATNLAVFPPVPAWILKSTTAFLAAGISTFPVDITINLAPGEKLFLIQAVQPMVGGSNYKVTIQATNLSILFASAQTPSIAYGIRPLDLLQQLVSKITNGKGTADSKFFAANNRKVMLSGSSLRSFPDAVAQCSFADFFLTYCSAYNMGVTVRNGVLMVEPLSSIYNNSKEILNLGKVSKASISIAEAYMYSSAKFGYQKQTYNKRNGRYEYNCTHTIKFPINTVLNELNRVSPWRADSFGMEFIRTDYPNLDSTDDKGDSDVFTVMISDSIGQTNGEVSTAIAFNVETLALASPIIKTPFSNTVIYSNQPTITGVSQPNMTITVYVDGEIDGTTTADADGNWTYELQQQLQSLSNTFNGVHLIEANASTDPDNVSGFSNLLTVTINTMIQSDFLITGPSNNDTLYNNLPLITGIAQPGTAIAITLDGSALASVVANTSGLWHFQITTPLSDGTHVIAATAPSWPPAPPVSISVNKNVSLPLITSLNYNDIIYNNLPLIKGVAVPGTVVPVYLDGGGGPIVSGIAGPLGTATADANGDWSFQVLTVFDSTGTEIFVIPDGLHILSTTDQPENVEAAISGYQLMRGSNKGPVMDYDAIKLDDQYIPPGVDPTILPPTLGQFLHPETLYNIEETTPMRMQREHDSIIKGFCVQQPGQDVVFNGADVNPNLVTKKGNVIFNEGANVPVNALAPGLYLPYFLNFTAVIPGTFNDIMTGISNDGYITTLVKDVPIYCLPIGKMTMKPATDEAQAWQLLISAKTPLASLLQVFSNGISINLGKNMIYLSDKNPLHFVKYNYTPPAGFHFSDIYDDWAKNRFPRWITQPDNYQPVQKTDTIALQAITNGVSTAQIEMFSVTTGQLIDTFPFVAVASAVALPNILQEVSIDPSGYPEGQYWFALFVDGSIIAISEKIWLKTDWPDTMLYKYDGSKDDFDYYFSTGIKPMIRVPSEWLPWDPDSEVDNYEDESGDFEMTRAIALKTRVLQLGSEMSLISDWLRLKMNVITLLSNLFIEGSHYTRDNNTKMEKVDFGQGVPEFMVKMEMILADNQSGVTFGTPGDTGIRTTTYLLDGTAVGRNDQVINVTIENE